jgi:hypothetical protein
MISIVLTNTYLFLQPLNSKHTTMIKKLAFVLLGATLLLNSCSETPFVPNSDNPLMVGTWNIDQVDNDAALVSGTEMMTSLLDDRFVDGNKLIFETGADFEIKRNEASISNGEYSISEDNKTLRLKIEGTLYDFDVIKESAHSFGLNSASPGESINMVISQQ